MEAKEFKVKLKETKGILQKAKVEYKKERTALSNKVLESYNIHVGDEIIYNNIIKNLTNKFFKDNNIPLKVGDRVIVANGKVGTIISLYTEVYKYIHHYNYTPMIRVELDENKYSGYIASLINIKKI